MLADVVVIGEVVGRWATRVASERERIDTPAILEELPSLNLSFKDHEGTAFPIAVHWLRNKNEYAPLARIRKRQRFDRLMPPSFVKLSCRIEYPDSFVANYLSGPNPEDVSLEEIGHLIAQSIAEEIHGTLVEIVLAANIARPASLAFPRTFSFIDGVLTSRGEWLGGYISEIAEDSERRGWPIFRPLTVAQVMRWLVNIPGFTSRHTETPLGRAVAAAAFLMTSTPRVVTLDLVWALLGLEALYSRGNTGLQQQLIERTEAFLGPRTTHKKDFSNMYGFRSRLIHGDMDFPYPNNQRTGLDRYAKFASSLSNSEDIAGALLFATLQQMCAQNLFDLTFSVVVDRKQAASD